MNIRACNDMGVSTHKLIKFISNLFQTSLGYMYRWKRHSWNGGTSGDQCGALTSNGAGRLVPIIFEVWGDFVMFIEDS